MYVRYYVYMNLCNYICVSAGYVCTYVCTYVCIHVRICMYVQTHRSTGRAGWAEMDRRT